MEKKAVVCPSVPDKRHSYATTFGSTCERCYHDCYLSASPRRSVGTTLLCPGALLRCPPQPNIAEAAMLAIHKKFCCAAQHVSNVDPIV
eukprot:6385250-Amphidinium_carterae.1